MRISVVAPRDESQKNFRLFLPVPLWIARWHFIWRFLPEESQKYAPIAKDLVRAMREYKRANGSWNLIEVDSTDGTRVRIRV